MCRCHWAKRHRCNARGYCHSIALSQRGQQFWKWSVKRRHYHISRARDIVKQVYPHIHSEHAGHNYLDCRVQHSSRVQQYRIVIIGTYLDHRTILDEHSRSLIN